jgi:hypothetical protein
VTAPPPDPTRWEPIDADQIRPGDTVRVIARAGWWTEGVADRWQPDAEGEHGILWLRPGALGHGVDDEPHTYRNGALISRPARRLFICRVERRIHPDQPATTTAAGEVAGKDR